MAEVTREMGCSIDDLVRWLPMAMRNFDAQTSLYVDGIELRHSESPLIEIVGVTRPPRKIALLSIPVLSLKFIFAKNLDSLECERIMERFDLYTRRGGG
ncbi:hypothetical protein [Polynucleobacter sp. MWH-UH35A]|uniref:hypothetical protein n=1 Tax=Polynucleobacter sp. MWH-UH35A TaxID=1855619 RepID=UPI001BFEEBD0|nr:hypothetical protein [Polynucleobacter sp. MWH-UH35A]QWD60303.1 hypothetical protein ICV36_00990 [Polynucleobacter sp. MWH-UH35A]